jgi:oxygen-independent coproporphyrinogen-3 oxidase
LENINKINQRVKKELKKIGNDISLYVNYPFCQNRCRYCIYYLAQHEQKKSDIFLKYYNREITLYSENLSGFKFNKLHVGGGTPSLISPISLFQPLQKLVNFKKISHFAIEVFPKDGLKEYLRELKKFGVTKILLGVQTLDEQILENENRLVSADTIIRNLEILSKSNLSWSVDLIYGLGPPRPSRDYVSDLKTILHYRPSGFHLYNIRSQPENRFYNKKNVNRKTGRLKYMDTFDFREINTLLYQRGYRLIGDEWCLRSDEYNKKLARARAAYYDEPLTIGLGLGARTRTRHLKYRNARKLQNYTKLLDKNLFPVEAFFDYQNRFFLAANILLAINQSSEFDLAEIFSAPGATRIERQEARSLISYLAVNKIKFNIIGKKYIVPRSQYAACINLIEHYLLMKTGRNYFYKN